jgi:FSR family fosmidomycin resistance protein-like MFS transporter
MQFFFGSLSDRGFGKALILTGILATASSAFLVFTQNYVLLFCIYFLTCLGSGAFHPSAISLMGGLSQERKALLITFFATGGSLGMALSQVIFSKFFQALETSVTLISFPSLLLVASVFFYRFPKLHAIGKTNHAVNFGILKQFFARSDLKFLYISQICNRSIFWGLVFLLPDILLERGYAPWLCFGTGHLCFILAGALMMIPSGFLADKYSPRLIIIGATWIAFFCYYLFLFNSGLPPLALLVLLSFLGASLDIVNPVSIAFGNELAPENPGMISAFLMGLVWCVAEVIGPGGGGILASLFEHDAASKGLMILGGLFFLGLYAAQQLPKGAREVKFSEIK